jgi:hypothetical protein
MLLMPKTAYAEELSLLAKAMLILLCLFGITALTMAGFSAVFLRWNLTSEYESKGTAIAESEETRVCLCRRSEQMEA